MEQKLDLLSPDEQAKFIAAARAWHEHRRAHNDPSRSAFAVYDAFRAFHRLMAAAAEGFDSD